MGMIAVDFVHEIRNVQYCLLFSCLARTLRAPSGDLPLGTGPIIAVYNSHNFYLCWS